MVLPGMDAGDRPSHAFPLGPGQFSTTGISDTLSGLGVDPALGLSADSVAARRQEFGYNEVPARQVHLVRLFLRKFWGVSAWMLELIMVLSLVLGRYVDFAVVGVLLVANAVLGFLQERRSAAVVLALRNRLQLDARVLRDGDWLQIPARDLVPGDILRLRAGDIVPADAQIVDGVLSVDQSALTGESIDVTQSRGQLADSGTLVRHGEATGVVVATGIRTRSGRATELVQQAQPKLRIEAVVAKVVAWLFGIIGVLAALVLVAVWVRGGSVPQTLPLLLVLLMSAVPVALPVIFTTSMAISARALSGHGVLVTRLSATEDAALMDVLCVDKTGTITMNQLTVSGVIPMTDVLEDDVVLAAAVASQDANQDPIDMACLAAAQARGLLDRRGRLTTVAFTPFDAANRRTESVVLHGGEPWRYLKGAIRSVALECALPDKQREDVETIARAVAAKGHRTLAVASGPKDARPVLLGLLTLHDPLRPDAAALIATLKGMGVQVKMLTGDALPVATEIGRAVGLDAIVRAADVVSRRSAAEHGSLLGEADGLAEIYPEDKYLVVRQLQDAGHATGMTGDGVNDAPALRQAEVGIAVSTATDVAKSAASVVLTEPGLTNIVSLVEQGRVTHQLILTWIINKISETILKATFVAIPYLITGRFLVSALIMLLLVLVTDFAKISLATDRAQPSSRPETWRIGGYVATAIALGAAMATEALAVLWFGWVRFGLAADDEKLFSFSFCTLLYFAVFSIVSTRERRRFWRSRPSRALTVTLLAVVAVGTIFVLTGLPGLAPLPWQAILASFGAALVGVLVINDALKATLFRRWVRAPGSLARDPAPNSSGRRFT